MISYQNPNLDIMWTCLPDTLLWIDRIQPISTNDFICSNFIASKMIRPNGDRDSDNIIVYFWDDVGS